jgi:hypothetical protein
VVAPAARDEAPTPQPTRFKPGEHPQTFQWLAEMLASRLELPDGKRSPQPNGPTRPTAIYSPSVVTNASDLLILASDLKET